LPKLIKEGLKKLSFFSLQVVLPKRFLQRS
jgi:hypothetical protein